MIIDCRKLDVGDERVGVYGTFKHGQENHHVLGESDLIKEGWLDGLDYTTLGPFPAQCVS